MLPLDSYGPFLRLENYIPYTQDYATWKGSVLFLCRRQISALRRPLLICQEYSWIQYDIPGKVICIYKDWEFWRFDIVVALYTYERKIIYWIEVHSDAGIKRESYFFQVPGAATKWRWAAYSCSGFSHDVNQSEWMIGEDHPMVRHLINMNLRLPFHAVIGGGDQLYNDDIFYQPITKQWLGIPNRKDRFTADFTEEMEAEADEFFFVHYCEHFGSMAMREMLSCIPNIMLWDDHDIFDGWGSYPKDMLECPVFRGLYRIARKYYMLFQHHTTVEVAQSGMTDLFGAGPVMQSFSFLRQLGPKVMLLGVDIRGERTKKQVLGEESWDLIFEKLSNISGDIRHLIIIFTVPIIYPRVPISERIFETMSQLNRFTAIHALFVKTGVVSAVMKWDEPDLLDDLVDHWKSDPHLEERRKVVERLQKVAVDKNLRVTFISGDVHCAALGRFYSDPKFKDLSLDPKFMPQIITSAIINVPPPKFAIRTMHISDTAKNRINNSTREKMVRLFTKRFPHSEKCLDRRNFLTAEESDGDRDSLVFKLWIEDTDSMSNLPLNYEIYVPPLKSRQLKLLTTKEAHRQKVQNPYGVDARGQMWVDPAVAVAESMNPCVPVVGISSYRNILRAKGKDQMDSNLYTFESSPDIHAEIKDIRKSK